MLLRCTRSALTALALSIATLFTSLAFADAPKTFAQAKVLLKKDIYFDQNHNGALGTFYCGCDWQWVGKTGGRVQPEGCGYKIRAIPSRGVRTEIEHVVPASWLGQQRQCWQNGGRTNCNKVDPVFSAMEANLHNITVAIGELNADRSNFRFGALPSTPLQHGQCQSKVDFKSRTFEPRDAAKGMAARIMFYMHDRYNLSMSEQQQRLLMAWNKQFPVSTWERERDRRIAKIMGHSNGFVTGSSTWQLGHRNSGAGVVGQPAAQPANTTLPKTVKAGANTVHGNRNSKEQIYHVPGCPNYSTMKANNIIHFANEADAQAAGYRKAKNCPK